MSEYESNLVKRFGNSDLGVNLTTILIDMEPWFIAKEVATILGYDDTTRAINRNVDEEDQKLLSCNECKLIFGEATETVENSDNFGGDINNTPENSIKINNFGMKFINESGLYSLIISSKKPEAKTFKRWVTSEVLPSIRKTGSYNVQKQVPQTYLEALKALVASEEEKEQLKLTNETLTQELTDVSAQRDKAIQTKQQISDSKTAKALGRVGGLVTANNRLKDELYGNRNRRTIKAVAIANHLKDKDINHYKLIKYCKEHNLEIIKVPDTNWNEVNSYPIEAFKAVYPELIID